MSPLSIINQYQSTPIEFGSAAAIVENVVSNRTSADSRLIRSYGSLDIKSPLHSDEGICSCFDQASCHSCSSTINIKRDIAKSISVTDESNSIGWGNLFFEDDANDTQTVGDNDTPQFWYNCFGKDVAMTLRVQRTSSKRRLSKISQLPTIIEDEE